MFVRKILQIGRRRGIWILERLVRADGDRRDLQVSRLLGSDGARVIEQCKQTRERREAKCDCNIPLRDHIAKQYTAGSAQCKHADVGIDRGGETVA